MTGIETWPLTIRWADVLTGRALGGSCTLTPRSSIRGPWWQVVGDTALMVAEQITIPLDDTGTAVVHLSETPASGWIELRHDRWPSHSLHRIRMPARAVDAFDPDVRFDDPLTPLAPPAEGQVFTAGDQHKLDGIEAGAQVNPPRAGAFTAADEAKLDGIEPGAQVNPPAPDLSGRVPWTELPFQAAFERTMVVSLTSDTGNEIVHSTGNLAPNDFAGATQLFGIDKEAEAALLDSVVGGDVVRVVVGDAWLVGHVAGVRDDPGSSLVAELWFHARASSGLTDGVLPTGTAEVSLSRADIAGLEASKLDVDGDNATPETREAIQGPSEPHTTAGTQAFVAQQPLGDDEFTWSAAPTADGSQQMLWRLPAADFAALVARWGSHERIVAADGSFELRIASGASVFAARTLQAAVLLESGTAPTALSPATKLTLRAVPTWTDFDALEARVAALEAATPTISAATDLTNGWSDVLTGVGADQWLMLVGLFRPGAASEWRSGSILVRFDEIPTAAALWLATSTDQGNRVEVRRHGQKLQAKWAGSVNTAQIRVLPWDIE